MEQNITYFLSYLALDCRLVCFWVSFIYWSRQFNIIFIYARKLVPNGKASINSTGNDPIRSRINNENVASMFDTTFCSNL